MSKKIIIAIDGHSSCGKSTIAKSVANILGYRYIDTGAMYRCVTLYAIQNNLIINNLINEKALKLELSKIFIEFKYDISRNTSFTLLNGQNVEEEIRSLEVSNLVSVVSKLSFVRERLVDLQRIMGKDKAIVMDGRDIGTVVFPDAELKLFVTANEEVRAKRRFDEMQQKGIKVTFEDILNNISSRDKIDSERENSPLRIAKDAIVLDNSYLTREEQLNKVLELVNQKISI